MSQQSSSLKRSSSDAAFSMNKPPTKRAYESTALETVHDDLNDDAHARLDRKVFEFNVAEPTIEATAVGLLIIIVLYSEGRLDPKYRDYPEVTMLVRKHPELMAMLQAAWTARTFRGIRTLKILHENIIVQPNLQLETRSSNFKVLAKAYDTSFVGDAAVNFIKYLKKLDAKANRAKPLYAKAISVVQSSGTGKSRMLTEVGKHIFTLPICLRNPREAGFPLADRAVFFYFKDQSTWNHLSITAYIHIACFLAALYENMLASLQLIQDEQHKLHGWSDGGTVHAAWHDAMEDTSRRKYRDAFFDRVVLRARELRDQHSVSPGSSPLLGQDGQPNEGSYDSGVVSKQYYLQLVRGPIEALIGHIKTLLPNDILFVTYFDEAHELQQGFWILLRLLQFQDFSMKMWHVFMATKSSISFFSPAPQDRLSLKLRRELVDLEPPYIALGFDQKASNLVQCEKNFSMGRFETIQHAAQYGRPLWHAQISAEEEEPDDILLFASLKLTSGINYMPNNKYHVFAVLSQRLCLEPVLAGAEAIDLADRSVAHHMRLLTSFSPDYSMFYTHSPSEPMLVLGAIETLYDPDDPTLLRKALRTLTNDLCSSGIIDKGNLGELCARILLLTARDYTVLHKEHAKNFLKPVRLLDVIQKLFGKATWADSNQANFESAFNDAYVNFTHWVITRDPLPTFPTRKLLANLWARNAILQCSHNQESLDFFGVTYFGSVAANAIFDPDLLSGFVIQVKYKEKTDKPAEENLRLTAIPRDPNRPLPYLALFMELGAEAVHRETGSKIKSTVPKHSPDCQFQDLTQEWVMATKHLQEYQIGLNRRKNCNKDELNTEEKLKTDLKLKRREMDFYNRYSVSVCGASPEVYGILAEADITQEFANLLEIISPSPNPEESDLQRMQPFDYLGDESNHMAWARDYIVETIVD